jgi:hypothetical protein
LERSGTDVGIPIASVAKVASAILSRPHFGVRTVSQNLSVPKRMGWETAARPLTVDASIPRILSRRMFLADDVIFWDGG